MPVSEASFALLAPPPPPPPLLLLPPHAASVVATVAAARTVTSRRDDLDNGSPLCGPGVGARESQVVALPRVDAARLARAVIHRSRVVPTKPAGAKIMTTIRTTP